MEITKRNKYWLTFVSLALLTTLSLVLYIQLHQSRLLGKAVQHNDGSISWGVFQLEREALRFLNEINETLEEPHTDNFDQLQLYFEILWSRVNVLDKNPNASRFLESAEYTAAIGNVSEYVENAESYFSIDADPVDENALRSIRERLKTILPKLQDLSNLSVHRAGRNAEARTDEVRKQIQISTGLVVFQLLLTVLFFYMIVRLVRQLQESYAKLDNLANYDSLTGLPNRRLFRDRLEQEVAKAERSHKRIAVMYIDLDNFKDVNDTQGHDVGDELLKDAAIRLQRAVRRSDMVSRLGGDEFTIIIPDLDHYETAIGISESILRQLQPPFVNGHYKNVVSASIGITIYPDDAKDANTLSKNADQAMYEAKKNGRNQYHCFTSTMQHMAQCRMRLINDLRLASDQQQFHLHYQPIVELVTGRVHKAEALIRWVHPEVGIIGPDVFIPLIEETGMIIPIGDWVFEEAARQAAIWRHRLDPEFQISINTSPVQLRPNGTDFREWVNYLTSQALDGSSIAIEIAEGILMDEAASRLLVEMQEAGFEVSLDDFGTGYSTLSYLKKFDINYLKIDRSFVQNLKPDSSDFALCEAIILMAHKLGIKVIAEGIETEEQCAYLTLMGCDYGQGYLFSKAVGAAEFERIVNDKKSRQEHILPFYAHI